MKKISKKQRKRDLKLGLENKIKKPKRRKNKGRGKNNSNTLVDINGWVLNAQRQGLNIEIHKNHLIILILPVEMNFYNNYELTALSLMAIRNLSSKYRRSNKTYRLASVNFDQLKSISTSAALVLTSELSKWDDGIRQGLRPRIDNWDIHIYRKLKDLGFFDLFKNAPTIKKPPRKVKSDEVNIVKYIKGECGHGKKTRILKEKIVAVVGEGVDKWAFLHGGLDEAITNVTHHAYPVNSKLFEKEKTWYLTGAYKKKTKELKVVFYDQGIGIPKSLPTSKVWEKALDVLSLLPIVDNRKDEAMLKAAVELDRTSTEETDRGKGLQDLLEFVKQRKNGYLSIISAKGLYKLTIEKGEETVKTRHFKNAIHGTLIIWSVTLN